MTEGMMKRGRRGKTWWGRKMYMGALIDLALLLLAEDRNSDGSRGWRYLE